VLSFLSEKKYIFFNFPPEIGAYEGRISSIQTPVDEACSLAQMQDLAGFKLQNKILLIT